MHARHTESRHLALCGDMLGRGWLDATHEQREITCPACQKLSHPANVDPQFAWLKLACTDCDDVGSDVSPEYVGLGQPCSMCGTGTAILLRDLQRQARLGRKLVAVGSDAEDP